jgi:hypothetical protein
MLLTQTTARSILIAAIAVFLGLLFVPTVARAQGTPPGSYTQSCSIILMDHTHPTTLSASCKDSSGNLHATSLPNAWTCVFDISNSNGQLQCHGGGPYTDTCSGATTYNVDGVPLLLATCPNGYGQNLLTSLWAPDSCEKTMIASPTAVGPSARILNINGNLRCVVWFRNDPSGHGNQDIMGKTTWKDGSQTRTYWTIDQPTITQPFTPYFTITFVSGDTVTLSASGCAQRGGGFNSGDTWADYTNQPGSGEYFGLAMLPGTGHSSRDFQNPAVSAIGPPKGVTPVTGGAVGINGISLPVRQAQPDSTVVTTVNGGPVPEGPQDPNIYYLTLGYVDDGFRSGSDAGYPDNGYYTHDNGNGSCTGVSPVGVSLEVDHPLKALPAPPPYSAGSMPFDVIYNQVDNNGLPMNPKWYAQEQEDDRTEVPDFDKTCGPAFSSPNPNYDAVLATAVFGPLGGLIVGDVNGNFSGTSMDSNTLAASCTSQAVAMDQFSPDNTSQGSEILDLGPICIDDGPIRGHLNWWPVTYSGAVSFSDYSGPIPQDNDINMSLIANGARGLTSGSVQMSQDPSSENYPYGGFLLEFDARETAIPYFKSSWWQNFANLALTAQSADLQQRIAVQALLPYYDLGPTAVDTVATGLFGIDGVHHGGITELHPLFSIAIHLIEQDVITSNGTTENWVFFIRNQGNEGNCSSMEHTLEPEDGGRDYYISLPWPRDIGSASNPQGPVSVSAAITATPWVVGASVGEAQMSPGAATYLHFVAPPYSGDQAPFFGFDGEVTLQYAYPNGATSQIVRRDEPEKAKAPSHETHASTSAKPEQSLDAEDFPWEKIISAAKDPAVKIHLQKFFTQKPPAQTASAPLPEIKVDSRAVIVPPKSIPHDAVFSRRTHTMVNVAKLRENDDLSDAAGYPHRTFQAVDAQHVFVLGTDRVLRLVNGPFNSAGGDANAATASTVIDRGIQTFEAVTVNEVRALRSDGALFIESAPFGGVPGSCIQGFVWRQAEPDDHVCVSPDTRAQTAADNAAGPSHIAPPVKGSSDGTCVQGFVWRESDEKDRVCVSPSTRSQTAADNALGPHRIAGTGQTRLLGVGIPKFKATGNANSMLLDANGKLWLASTPSAASPKPSLVAENVRAFQNIDPNQTLVLTTDDRLQSYPITAGNAAPPAVYENVWDFQQAADGSLFVIESDDTLWRGQPRQQIDSNVRKLQAIDANTIFVLKYDGTLSLRRTANTQLLSQVDALVATGVRAFQALDAQTVCFLDEDGKLWLEHGNFGPEAPTKALVATDVR